MIRDTESKITDEELFLSSAFQKYQTSLAKAATGRSRYGLQVLMEWDSSENADIAYTDNYRIWSYVKKKYKLNTTNFLFLCNC